MIGIMRDKIEDLLPVDGNRYFTPYGFYNCKVTGSETRKGIIEIKALLISEKDASEIVRVFRITGTRQAIKKERLSLVMEIHHWSQLDRGDKNYWVKKVQL